MKVVFPLWVEPKIWAWLA